MEQELPTTAAVAAPTPAPAPAPHTEECADLKNIQYKTMLYNKTILTNRSNSEECISDLDKFLETEIQTNSNEQNWNKLNKTNKLKKLLEFADRVAKDRNYDAEDKRSLVTFFRSCLDNKRLQRVKEVIYDAKTGTIKDIPVLVYNKSSRHFTLRNLDKHTSTLKALSKPLVITGLKDIKEV